MVANNGKLAGKTIFITGASRGIGRAIALKAAKDHANIVIAAKTTETHPNLPGTIYTVAEEVEKCGGRALPCMVDIRDEKQIQAAIDKAVQKFGGIDILINNASAISLTGTEDTDMKKYDLMHNINTRGTFLVSKLCLPHLKKSSHAHILNCSPPLNLDPKWFESHVAYTIAKYGMSMCVLGMAEEFKRYNIAVNALWPRTAIDTSAMNILTGENAFCRKPDIVADAAYAILTRDPKERTGQFLIDDEVVREAGIMDLDQYACDPNNANNLLPDFYLEVIPDRYEEFVESAGGQVAKIFSEISKNISPRLVEKMKVVFQFDIKDPEKSVWHLDLKNGSGSCGKGKPVSPPDATFILDSKVFVDMFAGKIKIANAFIEGKLKITGNVQKALKLDIVALGVKSKL